MRPRDLARRHTVWHYATITVATRMTRHWEELFEEENVLERVRRSTAFANER